MIKCKIALRNGEYHGSFIDVELHRIPRIGESIYRIDFSKIKDHIKKYPRQLDYYYMYHYRSQVRGYKEAQYVDLHISEIDSLDFESCNNVYDIIHFADSDRIEIIIQDPHINY